MTIQEFVQEWLGEEPQSKAPDGSGLGMAKGAYYATVSAMEKDLEKVIAAARGEKREQWQNNKNTHLYLVLEDNVTDATNATEGRTMVLYKSLASEQKYTREKEEFEQKFTKMESNK